MDCACACLPFWVNNASNGIQVSATRSRARGRHNGQKNGHTRVGQLQLLVELVGERYFNGCVSDASSNGHILLYSCVLNRVAEGGVNGNRGNDIIVVCVIDQVAVHNHRFGGIRLRRDRGQQ